MIGDKVEYSNGMTGNEMIALSREQWVDAIDWLDESDGCSYGCARNYGACVLFQKSSLSCAEYCVECKFYVTMEDI